MKKLLVVLLIALLAGAGIVAAQGTQPPGGGWESGQQIQNAGSSNANVVLNAYAQNGTEYSCDAQTLTPGASFTWLPANCSAPAGFQGSAVASSDQPIVAVVNVNNRTVGAAAGQYQGTSGSDVSTSISFPLVKHNHAGRTTTFYIQNASSSTNNITATFRRVGDAQAYVATYNNVPANAMVIVSPADTTPVFPSGTGTGVGGLIVSGTQPVAGSSLEHEHTATVAANLQASRGFVPGDYDSTVYCPLARYGFGALNTTTGLQVQNVGGSNIDVDVTYNVIFPAARTVTVPTVTGVAPGASANFLASDHLATGELASITVEATGEVAAITNDRADAPNPRRFTTYACFGAGNATNGVSLPLVKEDFFHNTTGVQVQNVGNAPATFTLTYTTNNGDVVTVANTTAVPAGESKTFFRIFGGGTSGINITGDVNDLNQTVSGVVITSNQPIVAIANESNYTGINPQDTKNYEGFNFTP